MGFFLKIISAIYPPLDLPPKSVILKNHVERNFDSELIDDSNSSTCLSVAESIYKAELERKKTIEDKAGTFFAGVSVAAGVGMSLPAFLLDKVVVGFWGKLFFLALVLISVVYFFISAYFSMRAKSLGGYYLINPDAVIDVGLSEDNFRSKWACYLLKLTNSNEPLLTLKVNLFFAAEQLFARGMIALLCSFILLGYYSVAYNKSDFTIGEIGKNNSPDAGLVCLGGSNLDVNGQFLAQSRLTLELIGK